MGHTSHLIMIIPFLVPATTSYHSVFPCVPTHPDMGGELGQQDFFKKSKIYNVEEKILYQL